MLRYWLSASVKALWVVFVFDVRTATTRSAALLLLKRCVASFDLTRSALAERPRDACRAMLRVIEYFAKSLKVTQVRRHPCVSCNCVCISFRVWDAQLNDVTVKSGLVVVQGHRKWDHSKAWVRFPTRIPLQQRPSLSVAVSSFDTITRTWRADTACTTA